MLETRWAKHLEESFDELLDNHFIVACSSGIDSVVLAHLCARLKLDFSLAHVNFQLRGPESDLDAEFVRELGKKIGVDVQVYVCDANRYASEHKVSIQVAAREIRYRWFQELADKSGALAVLTAHHLDDSIENLALQAARGTGIKGLLGVPPRRGIFWRPLLAFEKSELQLWAETNQLIWREDQSNAKSEYTRNKVRNDLLPVWYTLFPETKKNLAKTQQNLREDSVLLDAYLALAKTHCMDENKLDIEAVYRFVGVDSSTAKHPLASALINALLRPYGFDPTAVSSDWIFSGKSGSTAHTNSHVIHKNRKSLLIQSIVQPAEKSEFYYLAGTKGSFSEPIALEWSMVDTIDSAVSHRIYIDLDLVEFPLILRKRKPGDILYPTGMEGSKKLHKFFKDQKFSTLMKDEQWLLCQADGSIIWVVGVRQDRRWIIQQSTKQIVCIQLNS
ncbi:MAG: tRNA(Ile)-lysidine synthase [Bacteroidota bacterium]